MLHRELTGFKYSGVVRSKCQYKQSMYLFRCMGAARGRVASGSKNLGLEAIPMTSSGEGNAAALGPAKPSKAA